LNVANVTARRPKAASAQAIVQVMAASQTLSYETRLTVSVTAPAQKNGLPIISCSVPGMIAMIANIQPTVTRRYRLTVNPTARCCSSLTLRDILRSLR
jgi:hypothetical protein